ncbi:MAG: iron ABC transporter permease [Chitinophagaceae bacterium]|nr:iron ABC transporter permease [Chitinophagaceae bacterium]
MKKSKTDIYLFPVLIVLLIVTFILSAGFGAVNITTDEMFSALKKWAAHSDDKTLNERIFLNLRLPRAILCVFVGASLAVGGTLLQALFRNPIVEPGLIGTSSGAAFGSAFYFTLGASLGFNTSAWGLPIAAFVGGVLATYLVFGLSQSKDSGKHSVVVLLLIGIAINALCLSGIGFLSYISTDPQARSITFWSMGTLSGANWNSVLIVGIATAVCIIMALRYSNPLNALMLGENEAMFLGVKINRLKLIVLSIDVLMIAVATAFVGVIGFVGLVVPHLMRILKGADNRYLIRSTALGGAIMLGLADLLARNLFVPAELPIGIVTSIVGVPVFIIMLRSRKYIF